jgi:hypothetical protein
VKKIFVIILTAPVLAALAVCAIMISCTTPSIKAPVLPPVPKQEPITEEPAVMPLASTPAEEIMETDEPEEKSLVFHTEPTIIPMEAPEPEQAVEPELVVQPELSVEPELPVQPERAPPEPPPLQAEIPPEIPSTVPPVAATPPPVTVPPAAVPPPPVTVPPAVVPPVTAPPAVVTPTPPPPATVQASEPEPPPPEEQERPLSQERPSPAIPDMPFQPVSVIPEPAEKDLAYSRTVHAVIGQYIEIPFRGAGWVYLGEFGSRRGVSYDSRRMEPEGMSFIFRTEAEGTYSLKFNRQDFIHDRILNDYVKVIVEQPPEITGSSWVNPQLRPDRVYASPRWPTAVDPEGTARTNPERNTEQSAVPAVSAPAAPAAAAPTIGTTSPTGTASPAGTASPTATVPTTTVPATAASYADLLKNAQEEYNSGRIAGALRYLDQLMSLYPGGSDEAYWLYGQSLEANNEATRDIRLALDYYRRLVREFPQSSRYNEARRRIAYLERFYFNIQ